MVRIEGVGGGGFPFDNLTQPEVDDMVLSRQCRHAVGRKKVRVTEDP